MEAIHHPDFHFYQEFVDGDKRESAGTVVAVYLPTSEEQARVTGCYEAVGALFGTPDSPVCSMQVAPDFLSRLCRRIPEARAREVHPVLFEYLGVRA